MIREIPEKLLILWRTFIVDAFITWRQEVWRKDLGQHYCCQGDPMMDGCGCQGATVRDVYAPESQ